MLPASDLSAILTNLAALQLEPTAAAQILAAVLAPLLRSSDPDPPALPRQRAERPRRRPRRAVRSKPRSTLRRKRKYRRKAPTEARDRALAALHANPDATPTEIARTAKVSRSTAVSARAELAKEQRRTARKAAPSKTAPTDRRERAQRFLREQLGRGPRQVTDVESAASKAHVDSTALEQARADLGVVVSRGNAGGVMAVQWSLPG